MTRNCRSYVAPCTVTHATSSVLYTLNIITIEKNRESRVFKYDNGKWIYFNENNNILIYREYLFKKKLKLKNGDKS